MWIAREKYISELKDADVSELAIHRRLSRVNYSRRCAEASAVQAYQNRGHQLALGMEGCLGIRCWVLSKAGRLGTRLILFCRMG
jgi:hypothetical protein